MTTMTPELREEIRRAGHARLEDAETRESYVVQKADVYDRIRSLIDPEARDAYPLAMNIFGGDGWDDPVLDEYNVLDPRRRLGLESA